MDIIELVREKPSEDDPRRLVYAGQRTAEEVFQELKQRLEGMGYLPDEYFELCSEWENGREIPKGSDIICKVDYGESEGIYLDIGLTWYDEEQKRYVIKDFMGVYHVDRSMLPEIVHTPGKVVGHVTEEVSKKTGLPVGCNVCLGGLDTNCCAMGAGAKDAGVQVLIMGTAGVSLLVSDNQTLDPNGRIAVRSNPGFGNWQFYIMTNTGASAFRWFRDEICTMEVATSNLMGVDPYNIITATAANSKPGANGVTALTCMQGSHTRKKNEKARGSFFGVSLSTKKADIAQAILELRQ